MQSVFPDGGFQPQRSLTVFADDDAARTAGLNEGDWYLYESDGYRYLIAVGTTTTTTTTTGEVTTTTTTGV